MDTAAAVRPERSAAAAPSPALAVCVAALPVLLALFFWPTAQSAFLAPKQALLLCAVWLLCAWAMWSGVLFAGRISRIFFAGTLFVLLGVASAIVSAHRPLALQPLLMQAAGILLLPLVSSALRRRSTWGIHGIAAAGTACALLAIANRFGFDVFTPFGLHANYIGGRMQIAATLGNPNFVAVFVAACAPAALYLALSRTPAAWIARLSLALSFAAVWFTRSRMGMFALAIAIMLPLLLRTKRAAWMVVLIGALFAGALWQTNRSNPRSLITAARGRSLIQHVALTDGIHALGSGPGSFAYLYPSRMGRWFAEHPNAALLPFADAQAHAHNDALEFLVDEGWLGAAAFLFLITASLAKLMQNLKGEWQPFALAGTLAILAASLADFPLHRAETWALLWLWIALPLSEAPTAPPQRRPVWATILSALAIGVCVLAVRPVLASYHVHEGLAYEAQSSDRAAASEYQSALRWDRTNPDAQFYLARALANAGDLAAAEEQTRMAQAWVDEPELVELRARILLKAGKPAEALAALAEGLRRFPYARNLTGLQAELFAR